MLRVHQRAQEIANSWPERAWSYFRLVFGYASILMVFLFYIKISLPGSPLLLVTSAVTYFVGSVFHAFKRAPLLHLEERGW